MGLKENLLRLYHGTGGNPFRDLDSSNAIRNYMGKGIHASESPDLASFYAMQHTKNQRVMPIDIDSSAKFADEDTFRQVAKYVSEDGTYLDKTGARDTWDDQIVNRLKDMGYVGVKYKHEPVHIFDDAEGKLKKIDYPLASYSIFDSKNIKYPLGAVTLSATLAPQQAQAENWRNYQNKEPALQEPIIDPTTLLAGPARWGGGLANLVANTGLNAIMGKLR